jgi:MFS family permease
MLAYTVSFVDRTILSLLIPPIQQDLGISDTQISLLAGFAFAIFYTVMGIPLGRMADRYSRRNLIAIGITFWCLMTAACGLARNYTQLFLARVGVGVLHDQRPVPARSARARHRRVFRRPAGGFGVGPADRRPRRGHGRRAAPGGGALGG